MGMGEILRSKPSLLTLRGSTSTKGNHVAFEYVAAFARTLPDPAHAVNV